MGVVKCYATFVMFEVEVTVEYIAADDCIRIIKAVLFDIGGR